MSELRWRSRLLQTVGKGLLRLGTYFVRQAEPPPAASASPPDAPPWLPPEFWQQQRQRYAAGSPPAHWLALLAESQIPLQWVGTSEPPPALVMPAAAAGIEETTDDAGSVTLPPPWAAPVYTPAAPAPGQSPPAYVPLQNQRPTPGTGWSQEAGRDRETGRDQERGRIRGEPQGGESPGSKQPPAAARLMPTPETNAPLYAPAAPTAATPQPAFAFPSLAPPGGQMPALFQTPARSWTDDALAAAAAPAYAAAAPPLPGRVAHTPPGTPGDSRPAPEYGVSLPPPAPDAYRLPLASRSAPGAVLDAPPPVFAPPAANPRPAIVYPPPSLLPPEPAVATPPAVPPAPPRQPQAAPRYFEPPSTRYAAPGYEAAPLQNNAVPPVYAGWQSLPAPLGAESPPPSADRWPPLLLAGSPLLLAGSPLPPLFADDAPPAAQSEHLRQQRLEQEQRGERG
ncbi:MAG: hypothetical protein Fur0021_18110 [Candidatus Promineifilaceae bacterium]